MMGMPTLYLGGKAFAGLFGEAMVFKLEGEAHKAAEDNVRSLAQFPPLGGTLLGQGRDGWVPVRC